MRKLGWRGGATGQMGWSITQEQQQHHHKTRKGQRRRTKNTQVNGTLTKHICRYATLQQPFPLQSSAAPPALPPFRPPGCLTVYPFTCLSIYLSIYLSKFIPPLHESRGLPQGLGTPRPVRARRLSTPTDPRPPQAAARRPGVDMAWQDTNTALCIGRGRNSGKEHNIEIRDNRLALFTCFRQIQHIPAGTDMTPDFQA